MRQPDLEKEFEQHIRDHELLIHKVCRVYAYTSADKEDLFQEIVLQLWRSYPKFKGDARFSTWMYRVALNTAITGLRKKRDFITSYEPEALPVIATHEYQGQKEDEQLNEMYKDIEELNPVIELYQTWYVFYLQWILNEWIIFMRKKITAIC